MVKFYKYQGTGNDFIIFDSFHERLPDIEPEIIKKLCHRRFGIGADGLMILKSHPEYDFEMDYYNSDGSGSTLCGNGGRCIVSLAKRKGYIKNKVLFKASDGYHEAYINDTNVDLKMSDVEQVLFQDRHYSCYTGSPHLQYFVEHVDSINVREEGRNIRYSDPYKEAGTNVNFIEVIGKESLKIRTYERGVEAETYSCGTGSVASALTYAEINGLNSGDIEITAKGGILHVSFEKRNNKYSNIWLKGPATFIFEGYLNIGELYTGN
jgi:diaminopimelate epimerase